MTRKELEKSAEDYYTKEEIQILLRGFDIGMGYARDVLQKAVFDETVDNR